MPFLHIRVDEGPQKAKNQSLRNVTRAYKATLIRSVQATVKVPKLSLDINGKRAGF